jgi:oxygen-independent coproporphyrinogen-3 oxidase
MPGPEAKIGLYIKGKEMLLKSGYTDIGMDVFALPSDEMFKVWQSGKLHRTFMGYTTQNTGLLLGLGMSAISDSGNGFVQNAKTLHDYYKLIHAGQFAIERGYLLSAEEFAFRKYILDINCRGATRFREEDLPVLAQKVFPRLAELEKDGLIEWNNTMIKLTSQGRYFVRNVCSAFDLYLSLLETQKSVFRKVI